MLLRRIARPLFASWFVSEGYDAARRPDAHAVRARAAVESVARLVPRGALGGALDPYRAPTTAQVAALVRAHGAATAAAGMMLATGRAPRTAALALAALTAPLIVANLPLRERPALDKEARRDRRDRLVRAVAFTGGALLAGADYEGRPGVAWRVAKAREEHASAAQ
ncbi:DoxX family protein [Cellulomonas sp. WB94]|uniref:DoxX family membrane protein n=1 Tax=Cellulomonas sp. WB94 TaxID=2173174 RepID=UPI000D5838F7|nr:DoxX family membrane protein [Cellulomonas sp. WB94]PVU82070.1 DoxX family protein [Cellulomonas sp. WB94]